MRRKLTPLALLVPFSAACIGGSGVGAGTGSTADTSETGSRADSAADTGASDAEHTGTSATITSTVDWCASGTDLGTNIRAEGYLVTDGSACPPDPTLSYEGSRLSSSDCCADRVAVASCGLLRRETTTADDFCYDYGGYYYDTYSGSSYSTRYPYGPDPLTYCVYDLVLSASAVCD